jgi:hypothetical protein
MVLQEAEVAHTTITVGRLHYTILGKGEEGKGREGKGRDGKGRDGREDETRRGTGIQDTTRQAQDHTTHHITNPNPNPNPNPTNPNPNPNPTNPNPNPNPTNPNPNPNPIPKVNLFLSLFYFYFCMPCPFRKCFFHFSLRLTIFSKTNPHPTS